MEQQKALTTNSDRAVTYQAADGQDVRLTPDIVRRYLVQGKGELVTMQELMYFLNICRARKLNPLVKDCYLVKYSENEGAAIITSIDFFRKRARAQKDCKGWKKGVIVRTKDGELRDSFGLVLPDETLVGGWFEAQPEGWIEPFRLEVNLAGYLKKTKEGKITKFWQPENQPTMIAKVAETQGLRTLWPDEFQQVYSDSEAAGPMDEAAPFIDIEQQADGESFDTQIPKGIDRAALDKYLAVCSGHFKRTVEEIKIEASKDMPAFLSEFKKWNAKQSPPKGKQKQQETAAPAPGAMEEESGSYMDGEPLSGPCPNDGDRYKASHCYNNCFERVGCPAWE